MRGGGTKGGSPPLGTGDEFRGTGTAGVGGHGQKCKSLNLQFIHHLLISVFVVDINNNHHHTCLLNSYYVNT